MRKTLIIFFLLLGMGISNDFHAQIGGKKREKRPKRRGDFVLRQYKSHGHADEFARGSSGRRGKFARLFKKKKKTPWVYRSSGSRRNAFKANQYLFTRSRTQGKIENAEYLDKQNVARDKTRIKGNRAFRFRKYKSR